jgi:purine-nucleoside phosphorylase
VGPVVAGIAAARWLEREHPEAVVLVGTCGAYGERPGTGEVVVGEHLGLASVAAVLGAGYAPLAPPPIAGSSRLLDALPAARARVLTVQAITTAPALVDIFATAWDVEHMESFAVARACADAGVPFVPVLGVANRVGPDAHAEWKANRAKAEAAARAVAAHLRPG